MYYNDFGDFLEIYVLHGSEATQLMCGGIFNNYFIAICPQYVPVKEFWKSVDIWRRYVKWQSGRFLGHSIDFFASVYICDTVKMYLYIYSDIFSNVFHASSQLDGLFMWS